MSLSEREEAELDRIHQEQIFQAGLAILQAAVALRVAYDRDGAIKEAIKMYEMIQREGFFG